MKHWAPIVAFFVVCLSSTRVHGHGSAIHVEVAADRLVVSGGLLDAPGFAENVFVEPGEDGDPAGTATLSGFGYADYWNVPGFFITGMDVNSGLYLEVLARPVAGADPPKERALWFWNPATELIEDAPPENHFQLRKSALVNRILAGTDSEAPAPLRIAGPLSADMNIHNHGLLLYALHKESPPPAGAYGFFARLTSDEYAPSDPFLVLVNSGFVDGDQMLAAALAINTAAADAGSLPGDFNHNGAVDAADYTVWRNGLGSTYTQAHYTEWKTNFGRTSGGAGSNLPAASVPEPAGLILLFVGLWASLGTRFRAAKWQGFAASSMDHGL